MRNKFLLLLISSLAISQFVFAQIKFSFGTEIGINSSGLPRWEKYFIQADDSVKEKTLPVISPVPGLWTKVSFGKHFYTNLGVQYLWVGYKYHRHRMGYDEVTHEIFTDDNWENQSYQKISIPLSVGYNFKIKNVKANIFIGYKKYYFTKGSYYNKTSTYEKDSPDNITTVEQTNPLDKSDYNHPIKRWNSGLMVGVGADISKKLNLSFIYSNRQELEFFNSNNYGWDFFGYIFGQRDIALTLKYTIK